jgi:hypothetical protein
MLNRSTAHGRHRPVRRAAARRRRLTRLLVVAALLTLAAVPVALGASGPKPGQRIDLKVLLVAATGNEPGFGAWKADLEREGVPYDTIVADNADGTISDARLADYGANRAYYQAVILATGDLEHQVGTSFPTALTNDEWASLAKFESTFGIRQLSDATFPSPAHGLTLVSSGEQSGNATLTAAGLTVFPYLKGPVTIDATYGHQATPANPANFQTLLTGPGNSAYLGIYTHPEDGREEMVMTVTSNQFMTHNQLLRHGMLNWVTQGVYLGHQRNYFETQVDDIFLPDDRWDMAANKTAVDGPTSAADEYQCDNDVATTTIPDCHPIRMVPADVDFLLAWQNSTGVKLDLVFNGGGSDEYPDDHNGAADPLAPTLLANKSAFRWINHTYDHPNLDTVSTATISNEILDNVNWAQAHGIPIDPAELVTGEHSGLHNPNMPAALTARGIRWIAADNSREPSQYAVGPALTVPRYPSNVYYNVGSQAEELDEYNYIYLPPALGGKCVDSPTNTCRTAPATWEQYVASEANIMFGHLMANDPRPHYAHQSNLTEGRTLYPVLDALLARYNTYFKPPLEQLSETQIGEELARQDRWKSDLAAGKVSAYLKDGKVTITTTETLQVPVTGVSTIGSDYGGTRSGWTTVSPAAPVTADPVPDAGLPAVTPDAPPAPAPAAGGSNGGATTVAGATTAAPKITALKVTPKRFAAARTGRGRKAGSTGARASWTLSSPATMRLSIQRVVTGRKVAKTCVPTSQRNRKRPKCERYLSVATITQAARQGNGSVKLTGKIAGRTMAPGAYRILATAEAAGRSSVPVAARFTVTRG